MNHKDNLLPTVVSERTPSSMQTYLETQWRRVTRRRAFLKNLGILTAGLTAAPVLTLEGRDEHSQKQTTSLPPGDVAILKFLAAAEILESDLWSQYSELGGTTTQSDDEFQSFTGGNPAYTKALQNLDTDMPQYILDNTDDELSHAAFINAYLMAHGEQPVDLSSFATLPGSTATGAQQGKKRLTNLMALNIDTSYYTRYRSNLNPDLGATFTGPVTITNRAAIPVSDADTTNPTHTQAIANTAAFHFAFIEVGGSSLYPTLALKVSNLEVLRILLSIGGVEIDHFSLWHDKLGSAVSTPLAPLTDGNLTFPDLNAVPASQLELTQTNKILPEPCQFLDPSLPNVSIIRPTSVALNGAVAAAKGLTADQLFAGQSAAFFATLTALAVAADAAQRSC